MRPPRAACSSLPGMDAAPTPSSAVRPICFRCASATTASNRITLRRKQRGKPCVVLNFAGIAVDVDNPEDLQKLISLPGETRAQILAREFARAGTGSPTSLP